MKTELLGWVVIGIWMFTGSLLKQAIVSANGNVLTVVVSYNLLAAVILLGISFFTGEYKRVRGIKKPWKYTGLICLNGFYDVMLAGALAFTASVQYGLTANYLWPVLMVVFLGIRKKNLSRKALVGAGLGFIGVLVVLTPSHGSFVKNLYGVALGSMGGLMWALYSSQLDEEHNDTGCFLQGLAQALSGVTALGVALSMGLFKISDIMNVPAILCTAGFGVLAMSIGYTLWIKVVTRHADMQAFSVNVYLLPLMSIIISTVWFGGAMDWKVWAGFSLVFSGIIVSRGWKHFKDAVKSLLKLSGGIA